MNFALEDLKDNPQKTSPLVSSVAARLTSLILSNRLTPGQDLPPERQLALDFDVSRSIVRSAIRKLNEDGLLDVKRNCRPTVSLKVGPHSVNKPHVGIWLWPNSSDFAAASLLKGIQSSPLGDGIRLVIGNAARYDMASSCEAERNFLETLADDTDAVGTILWYLGGNRNLKALQKVRSQGKSLVFVDRLPPSGFDSDYVGTNNVRAAYNATRYLIEMRHRNIALISNVDAASSVSEREKGFHLALTRGSNAPTAQRVFRAEKDDAGAITAIIDEILSLKERPTALFCINDQIALRVCEDLKIRGISVPDEMSVMGFDGMLRWIPGGGFLTTMVQDFESMGLIAADLLAERLKAPGPAAFKHYLLEAPMLDKGSVATAIALSAGSAI
jgi:DNA-binding LacI/PurR family transcriptional regulator